MSIPNTLSTGGGTPPAPATPVAPSLDQLYNQPPAGGSPPPVNPPPPASPAGGSPPPPPAPDPIPGGEPNGTPPSPAAPKPPQSVDTVEGILPLLYQPQNTTNSDVLDLRSSMLETFNGKGFDVQGNLLGDNGQILLASEHVKQFIETEELPVNDKGEVVNALGEVITGLATPVSIVETTRTALETSLGIQFPEDFSVEDDENGVVALTEKAIKIKSIGAVRDFLDAYPDVKGYFQHMQLGGTPDTYKANIDYKQIEVKKLSADNKKSLLMQAYTMQGVPNKEAIVDLIVKAGEEEVNKNVAASLSYLDSKQVEKATERETKLREAQARQQEATTAYWNTVNETIKKGALGDITIPAVEREKFFNYMSKPINDKYDSEDDIAAEKDSLDFQLLVSYLRFNKGNVGTLVKTLSSQQKVLSLRDRANKLKNRNDGGTGGQSSARVDRTPITLETLYKGRAQ